MDMIAQRHASEFLRALRNRHYEYTEAGLLFPKQKFIIGGCVEHTLNGKDRQVTPNLVTLEGIDYLFAGGLASGAVVANLYVAPYAANVAPVNTLTHATWVAAQTEFTNYTETTRQQWVQAGSSGGVISNTASPANITVGTPGQTTVYGLAIVSASAKSAVTGVLVSVAAFSAGRTGLLAGDLLGFKYTLTGTST
jgi:hypothetical protein